MTEIIELQRFFLSSSDDIVSDGLHSHILQFLWEKYVSLHVTKTNVGVLSYPIVLSLKISPAKKWIFDLIQLQYSTVVEAIGVLDDF